APFSDEAFLARYNADLANDLGNTVSRVAALCRQSYGGTPPQCFRRKRSRGRFEGCRRGGDHGPQAIAVRRRPAAGGPLLPGGRDRGAIPLGGQRSRRRERSLEDPEGARDVGTSGPRALRVGGGCALGRSDVVGVCAQDGAEDLRSRGSPAS